MARAGARTEGRNEGQDSGPTCRGRPPRPPNGEGSCCAPHCSAPPARAPAPEAHEIAVALSTAGGAPAARDLTFPAPRTRCLHHAWLPLVEQPTNFEFVCTAKLKPQNLVPLRCTCEVCGRQSRSCERRLPHASAGRWHVCSDVTATLRLRVITCTRSPWDALLLSVAPCGPRCLARGAPRPGDVELDAARMLDIACVSGLAYGHRTAIAPPSAPRARAYGSLFLNSDWHGRNAGLVRDTGARGAGHASRGARLCTCCRARRARAARRQRPPPRGEGLRERRRVAAGDPRQDPAAAVATAVRDHEESGEQGGAPWRVCVCMCVCVCAHRATRPGPPGLSSPHACSRLRACFFASPRRACRGPSVMCPRRPHTGPRQSRPLPQVRPGGPEARRRHCHSCRQGCYPPAGGLLLLRVCAS